MIKKLISLASILSLTLIVSSTSFAATYSITMEDLGADGLDIAGFTFWLDGDIDFVTSNQAYGPGVPLTWVKDTPHNSHFGAADWAPLIGGDLTPLSNGVLVSFDYEGTINPSDPFKLVKFTNTSAVDLFSSGEMILRSFDASGATFAPVPIPGAVWLLGSGLIGLAGLRRKKNKA